MDVDALVAEIKDEAERMRKEAGLSPELESSLEESFSRFIPGSPARKRGQGLKDALREATRAANISPYVEVRSHRRVLGPILTFFKRIVRKLTFWYFAAFSEKAKHSAQANLDAIRSVADRLEGLESKYDELRESTKSLDEIGERVEGIWQRMESLRLEDRLGRFERMLRYQGEKIEGLPAGQTNFPSDPTVGVDQAPTRSGEQRPVEREFDYFMFQMAHRGGPSALEEQKRRYLPHLNGDGRVLDLGCGRGEFLEALKEAGIDAYGIDIHPEMVAICKEKGLEAIEGDGLGHLLEVEAGSLGGLYVAQVIEHFEPDKLVELVKSAHRALGTDGVFLAETINPTVLGVFSAAFYADLSHEKPVHPATIQFLLESTGFKEVKFEWMFPFGDDDRLRSLPEEDEPWMSILNTNLEKLNNLLYGPQDYAVVAKKA